MKINRWQLFLIIMLISSMTEGCSSDRSYGKGKTIKIIDKRDGKEMSVECDKIFVMFGDPQTVIITPLTPEINGAILSSYEDYVAKALKQRTAASYEFLSALHESMRRGNLLRVPQIILFYECTGEVLPL